MLASLGLASDALAVALELPSNEAVLAAVVAGAGASVLSETVVATSLRSGTLVAMPFDLPTRTFQVLRHSQRDRDAVELILLHVVARDGHWETRPRRDGHRAKGVSKISNELIPISPDLLKYDATEFKSTFPFSHLKFGSKKEFRNKTNAKIRHNYDMLRYGKDFPQILLFKNADPADADSLGPRGEPKVLHGANGAIEIRISLVRATEYNGATTRAVASDTNVQRRLSDAFQFQVNIIAPAFFGKHPCSFFVSMNESLMDPRLSDRIANEDEIPGLHQSDGWGVMCRVQYSMQDCFGNLLVGKFVTHIAPCVDRAIDGFASGLFERNSRTKIGIGNLSLDVGWSGHKSVLTILGLLPSSGQTISAAGKPCLRSAPRISTIEPMTTIAGALKPL